MSEYHIEINSLIIIQSLPENNPKDPRTGNDIWELAKNLEHSHESFVDKVLLYNIFTKSDFFDLMNDIAQHTEKGLKPILHFEMHGDATGKNGIVLEGSNEYISWSEIQPYFRRINVQMKNSLIVCLGVCYGQYCELQIDIKKRSPFMLLIAPPDEVYPNEILTSFESFYNSLVYNNSITEAMKLVKEKNIFKLIGSQFSMAYFRDITLKGIKTNKLRNNFLQRFHSNDPMMQNDQTSNKMQWYIRSMQSSIIRDYIEKRENFLMLDLYPGEAKRYTESEIHQTEFM